MVALMALARLAVAAVGGKIGLSILGGAAALDIGPFADGGGGLPRRRRRKRALSSNDRQDIAFMAGFLTKAGLERAVAVMIAR